MPDDTNWTIVLVAVAFAMLLGLSMWCLLELAVMLIRLAV